MVRFHVAGKRRRIHGLGEPHIFYFKRLCVEVSYLLRRAERLVDSLCHGVLRVVDLPVPPPVVDLAGSLIVFPDAVLEKLRRRVIVGPRLIQKGPIRLAGNIQESLCPLPRLIANENSFQQRSNIVFADLRSCAGHVAHDIFRVRGRVRQHGEIPPLLQTLAQRRRDLIRNILIDIVKCRLLRRFRCGILIRIQKRVRNVNLDLLVSRPPLVDLRFQVGNHLLYSEDSALGGHGFQQPGRLYGLACVRLDRRQCDKDIGSRLIISRCNGVGIKHRSLRNKLRAALAVIRVTDEIAADLLDGLASGVLLFDQFSAVLKCLLIAVDLIVKLPVCNKILNPVHHLVRRDLCFRRRPGKAPHLCLPVHAGRDIDDAGSLLTGRDRAVLVAGMAQRVETCRGRPRRIRCRNILVDRIGRLCYRLRRSPCALGVVHFFKKKIHSGSLFVLL